MSDSQKGKSRNKGVKRSDEFKRKLSESKKGKQSKLKGKKYTEEEKERIYASRRKQPNTKIID